MTRLRLPVVAALALTLLFSSCSADDEEEPLEARTPVARDVQTNPDRDPATVSERAAAVDPCALLAAESTTDAVPEGTGPHSCWLSDSSVRADVLTSIDDVERHRMARIEVGGAVAYRAMVGEGKCEIHLPVSHQRAISFSGLGTCASTTSYAGAAARLLQENPDAVTRPRGLARVSTCELAEGAGLATLPWTSSSNYSILDRCDIDGPVDLQLEYDDTVVRDYQTARQVAGTTVRTQQTADSCYVHFPLAPADIAVRDGDMLSAWVTTSKCAKGLAVARKLIVAAQDARTPGRAPIDLLYAWDESDTAAVGACVDFSDRTDLDCSPAEDADVPDDHRELIMEAEADPDVLCAAATPVVREHYGETFAAVTALASPTTLGGTGADDRDGATQCAFATPDHTFEISIVVSTAASNVDAEDDVAGHPAVIQPVEPASSTATTSYVVARDEADQPGFLAVALQAWPARGTGIYRGSGETAKPDLSRISAADDFVADLTEALL